MQSSNVKLNMNIILNINMNINNLIVNRIIEYEEEYEHIRIVVDNYIIDLFRVTLNLMTG